MPSTHTKFPMLRAESDRGVTCLAPKLPLESNEELLNLLAVCCISRCHYFFQRPLEGNHFFVRVGQQSGREEVAKLMEIRGKSDES